MEIMELVNGNGDRLTSELKWQKLVLGKLGNVNDKNVNGDIE